MIDVDTKKFTVKLSVDEEKSLVDSLKLATELQQHILNNPDYLSMAYTVSKIPLKDLFDQSIRLTNTLRPLALIQIKKDVIQIRESVVRVLKPEQKEIEPEKIESEEHYQTLRKDLERINGILVDVIATQKSHGSTLMSIKKDSKKTKEKTEELEKNLRPSTTIPLMFSIAFLIAFFFWALSYNSGS